MKNAPVLHRLEYGFFAGLSRLLAALPHETSRHIGRLMGDLAWLALRDRRHVTLANLRRALPDLAGPERRAIGAESFRHLGTMSCDTISSYRFDRQELCRRLTIEGWEHLEAARAQGRGVLVMSAHLGTWEIAAHVVGLYAEPMHVIGRPLDNPQLNRRLAGQRSRFGNSTIPKRGAARGALRILRQGGIVGILIDQRVRPIQGTLVPFFGHPAITSPLLGQLALKTRAPIVPLFGHLAPRGSYRVEFHPPIDARVDGDGAIETITQRSLEVVEGQIRQAPDTWLWLHRRWKQ